MHGQNKQGLPGSDIEQTIGALANTCVGNCEEQFNSCVEFSGHCSNTCGVPLQDLVKQDLVMFVNPHEAGKYSNWELGSRSLCRQCARSALAAQQADKRMPAGHVMLCDGTVG